MNIVQYFKYSHVFTIKPTNDDAEVQLSNPTTYLVDLAPLNSMEDDVSEDMRGFNMGFGTSPQDLLETKNVVELIIQPLYHNCFQLKNWPRTGVVPRGLPQPTLKQLPH